MGDSARVVLLVAAGGAVGTLARDAVLQPRPDADGAFPLSTLTVNLLGALLLGWVLAALVPRRRSLRPLLATGLLGSFTTFSGLATGAVLLLDAGRPVVAAVYALSSVVGGLVAARLGLWVGARPAAR